MRWLLSRVRRSNRFCFCWRDEMRSVMDWWREHTAAIVKAAVTLGERMTEGAERSGSTSLSSEEEEEEEDFSFSARSCAAVVTTGWKRKDQLKRWRLSSEMRGSSKGWTGRKVERLVGMRDLYEGMTGVGGVM